MDLDLFDDILGEKGTKNVRAGVKFQPKGKPRPVKKNLGVISVTNTQTAPTADITEGVFSAVGGTENASSSDNDRSFGLGGAAPSDQLPSSENSAVALDPVFDGFVPNGTDNWQSCSENPMGESADIYIGLDTLDDFLPDSATVLVDHIPSSEAANIDESSSKDAEQVLADANNPPDDDPTSMSNIHMFSQPEASASNDPLTGSDPIVSTNRSITDNENLETEELQAYPCLENIDMSEFRSSSGQRIGKFQPKLKIHAHRQRSDTDSPNLSVAELVNYNHDTPSTSPGVDVVDLRSGSAFTQDGEIGFSSTVLSNAAPSQSTLEALAAEAPTDFAGISHQEADIPGKRLEADSIVPGKLVSRRASTGKGKVQPALDRSKELASTSNETAVTGISLRKRKKPINDHKLIDESEDEVLEDGTIPVENVSNSFVVEDDNADDGFERDDELQKKKVQDKSKKSEGEKDKSIRKRKKKSESSAEAAKATPKKFSHRTRRKVDKALLEIPEDERDFTQIPLRDLILLAEHKEQTVKKAAKTSQAQLQNQRNGNHTGDGVQEGDETSDRGEVNDEEENCRSKESSSLFNYHTHMDKTPRLRWSSQDTELFYEGVQQFGSDLSMILHLFPGKTRHQMKLKYKQEERQHPKRLNEVLSNPAKDYSHFNMVIERLKQKAAEDDQSIGRADSVSLTGEEEMEEDPLEADVHLDEAAKLEHIGESGVNENMKPEGAESQSVVETYDETSDDDFLYEYKSEL